MEKLPVDSIPPTPLQQACVARSLLSPAGGHYIQQYICEWTESVNVDAWRRAWDFIATRHDSLRIFFRWDHSVNISQHFAAKVPAPIDIRDNASREPDRQQVVSDFLSADRRRGFDVAAPPLWRLTVFPWSDHETTTVWTVHHGLLDGRSQVQIWQEVTAVYRGFLGGPQPELPPPRSFSEFIFWLGEIPKERAAAYWRQLLLGFQTATDLPSLSMASDSGEDDAPPTLETLVLDADVAGRLREAARRNGVTLNNFFQGAWALLLARYQGVEDVVFGVVRSCRHWTKLDYNERTGMFINTIPFRVRVKSTQPVGEWLKDLRHQQFMMRAGEYDSAEQIRRWCGLPKSAALFRTCLMFDNRDPFAVMSAPGQKVRLVEKTDLPTLAVYEGDVLTLTLDYLTRRHPAAQARMILRHVWQLLDSLASASPQQPLGEIQMLAAEDRRLILDEWQGPVTPQPAPPLHRVLEAQAARTPDAPAVEFLGHTLSFREFHRHANQLARRLLQFCQPGDRVAVVLDRAVEQPLVWVAALKAGLVYAPVDPANPRQRLEFIFGDLQPAVLLTQQSLLPLLPTGMLNVLRLDDPAERAAQAALDAGHLDIEPPAGAAANLLYTSGSTGMPKAAINTRAGLDNFAAEVRRTFDVGPGDRVLQSSSTSFDVSMFDLAAALQSGATLVLVPSGQLRPGPSLTRLLTELRISVVLLTPTVMRSTPVPPPPAVRMLLTAGEPLTTEILERWSAGRRMYNAYGPTECSIWVTCEECQADGNRPNIGRPVLNCRNYVLDENQQLLPPGVPGELYLGGLSVGPGYWNREALTAEKYLPDPFAGTPNARMYRTGDRARWLADGRIEYLGRLDFQVKVQGVRVELGEIETAMRRHPAVADAALVLHDDRLLAWFIPREKPPSDASLRAWLADHIPLVFMPAEFHASPQLPRTVSGKINRQALLETWLAAQSSAPVPIPELTADERRQVIEEWNQTARPYPLDRSVVDFFHEQVRQRPEAPALKSGGKILSYTTLNRRANSIAHELLRAGLKPEDLVVLRFPRSIAYVVGALAVLKAGGSYLPLDAHVPTARQDFVLKDSGARFALMAGEFLSTLAGWSGWSAGVEDDETNLGPSAENNPDVPSNPRRRAYVIYTSGSTGQPKGVEIEHRSLANLICFYHERLQLTSADRTTLLANPAFDASVADLWPVLCIGGTVLIPDGHLLGEPDRLIAWLAAEGAAFSFIPTAIGELLFNQPWPQKLALRYLCVGGEALRRRPPAGLPFSVMNSYGPTENTVDSTWENVLPAAPGLSAQPSIGRPIANVRAYVLDQALQPVAVGTEGELFLGGAQVARGYLNRPELTRERFLPDPFAGLPNARMYRTGDVVRWLPEGTLEFLGRNDDQIQIHGQRVELGEIEAALRQHPSVREACCRPIREKDSETVSGVVAHVVAPGLDDSTISQEFRQFLASRLPEYMLPTLFIKHESLPLTPQGKVDRKALDAAAQTRAAQDRTGDTGTAEEEDSLVRVLTDLWHRILPDSRGARADQTFQELGGDSLGIVKLLLGVQEITSRRLAHSTFLLEPTLAGLCRAVTAAEDASRQPILALRRSGTKPPLFCLYNVSGDVESYFDLVAELGEDQPVFGIRSSALHQLDRKPESIEVAAREIRQLLRDFAPKGPYALVGFSWAGLLAFEVARQCSEEDGVSPFCALLGSAAPTRQRSFFGRLGHAMGWLPGWAWRLVRDPRNRRSRVFEVVSTHALRRLVLGEKPLMPDWAVRVPLAVELIGLARFYQPAVSRPVPIHLFREHGSFQIESQQIYFALTNHLPDGGWEYWAGCPPEMHWLEGEHLTVIKEPYVKQTAAELRSALAKHFAAH